MHTKRTLPKIEDIRGTASLSDVATDVLIIAAVPNDKITELSSDIKFPMYFHLAKSRTAAEVTKYCGIVGFDFKSGMYDKKYSVTQISSFEDPKIIPSHQFPTWTKNALSPIMPETTNQKKELWQNNYE